MENTNKRTLRIIVEDSTDKNPIPSKARIWVRGYGDLWQKRFSGGVEIDVNTGEHVDGACIYLGLAKREHPGCSFDYVMPPVEHKVKSTAYFTAGTIYVVWFDYHVCVHGVPIGHGVLQFDRGEDKPQPQIDLEALEKRVAALEQKSHADHWDQQDVRPIAMMKLTDLTAYSVWASANLAGGSSGCRRKWGPFRSADAAEQCAIALATNPNIASAEIKAEDND